MNDDRWGIDRIAIALERIAAAQERLVDVGEAANASDPLLALQRAMEAPPEDPDADMPPHIRRAAGRE